MDDQGLATVSVDVDPVDVHLEGYGHRRVAPDRLVWRAAVPRIVEVCARVGLRATFFVVGRDAAPEAAALRDLVAAGHEVASHSMTHPMPFLALGAERIAREVEESRRALEAAAGVEVRGFRAPHWDADERLLAPLARAGYRYDASLLPTLWLPAARLALAARGTRATLRLRRTPFTLARAPFTWGGRLREFPVSVAGRLRLPLYHTARWFTDERRFAARLDACARRGEPLSYALHAVDALGLREDGVDPRLARHPGMDRPLAEKLAVLESSLRAVAARFRALPFGERLP